MPETHPYFIAKARDAFTRAGGDPDMSGPLAEWAQTARVAGDSRVGVGVAQDGQIIARTRHTPGTGTTCGGTYVYDCPPVTSGKFGLILDMAMGHLSREHGQPMIHVKYSDVCQGAGRFAGLAQ